MAIFLSNFQELDCKCCDVWHILFFVTICHIVRFYFNCTECYLPGEHIFTERTRNNCCNLIKIRSIYQITLCLCGDLTVCIYCILVLCPTTYPCIQHRIFTLEDCTCTVCINKDMTTIALQVV